MTCPYCDQQHSPGAEGAQGSGLPFRTSDLLVHYYNSMAAGGGGAIDPRAYQNVFRTTEQTKLERAQAYALEVRKRKFQVKRITGDQHG